MNARYLELFETRRHENELLCAWERHKKALRGRKPANGTPREASSSARKRDAPTRSASIIKGVARLASRGDERLPLGSARVPNASSRSSPRSSPFPNTKKSVAATDVDALASSLARRLGVTSGRLRAVRSVGARGSSEKTKRMTASTLRISAPLAVQGEGRKKAAVPESASARARRR